MANIRRRGDRWQVQVRRKGAPPTSRTFFKKQDAELWARQTEVAADRRELPIDPACLDRLTLGDIITRYRDTISPKKRGHDIERVRLNTILRHRLADKLLSTITRMSYVWVVPKWKV
ncbi:MAG: site-specific integrase, partial [Alphaproteobacteria bacterium]